MKLHFANAYNVSIELENTFELDSLSLSLFCFVMGKKFIKRFILPNFGLEETRFN